jgi:hypothetical protein
MYYVKITFLENGKQKKELLPVDCEYKTGSFWGYFVDCFESLDEALDYIRI